MLSLSIKLDKNGLGYILGYFSKNHLVTLVTTAALKKMTTPRMAYLVRFENKNIFLYFKKKRSILHLWSFIYVPRIGS
jgi:hypothetical protein